MTDFSSYSGERVVSAKVAIPYYGTWSADIAMSSATAMPDVAAPLVIGDLSMIAAPARAASFADSRTARVVGGYGGWRKPVPRQGYRGANVRISTVLGDAAAIVGERVSIDITDVNLGRFARAAGRASLVLRQVAGDSWYVAPNGVTHVGPRPSGAISSDFEVIGWSGNTGRFTISTETLADWMPGRSFTAPTVTGTHTIGYVEISTDSSGKLRLEVLAS